MFLAVYQFHFALCNANALSHCFASGENFAMQIVLRITSNFVMAIKLEPATFFWPVLTEIGPKQLVIQTQTSLPGLEGET